MKQKKKNYKQIVGTRRTSIKSTKQKSKNKECRDIGKLEKKLLNKVFGDLLVIKIAKISKNGMTWICRCECGKIVINSTSKLLNGLRKSRDGM